MDQKWPNSDFQPQNSMSNTDLIHLKMISYFEFWIRRTIFIIAMIWLVHFWQTSFSKEEPYFGVTLRKQSHYVLFYINLTKNSLTGLVPLVLLATMNFLVYRKLVKRREGMEGKIASWYGCFASNLNTFCVS